MNYVPMATSKSTDKLAVICETIEQKILSDSVLKERVSKISITWIKVEVSDGSVGYVSVPNLEVIFK